MGGEGAPIVLLHGFPQTHLMWRHVAPALADHHTVICPDLRGYGASSKPAASQDSYAKRTMAVDIVGLADALGFDRFALVGHDRGDLFAFRLADDPGDRVSQLGILDIVPTLDTWNVLHGVSAAVAFHLDHGQPAGLPEQMIANSADEFFGHFLDIWSARTDAIPADVRAEYLRACRMPCRRSSLTTGPPRPSTSCMTRPTSTPETGSPCPSWSFSRTGAASSDLTRPQCGGAGSPTGSTSPPGPVHFMAEEAPDDITTLIGDLVQR